jgi:hypothetical protein
VGLARGRDRALEQWPERRHPSREGRVDAKHRGVRLPQRNKPLPLTFGKACAITSSPRDRGTAEQALVARRREAAELSWEGMGR